MGVDESEDFLVFGRGIDGSGVVGGKEGRGRAVVAMSGSSRIKY